MDWIAVFDDVVLLVEVKSARPTEAIRVAAPNAHQELHRRLSRGFEQVNRDARLILDGDLAFSHIPRDRPLIGVVVTMEAFHVVNAPMYRERLLDNPCIEIRVMSSHELEPLVRIEDVTVGRALTDFMTDPEAQDSAIGPYFSRLNHRYGTNKVMDLARSSMPWIIDRDRRRMEDGRP